MPKTNTSDVALGLKDGNASFLASSAAQKYFNFSKV